MKIKDLTDEQFEELICASMRKAFQNSVAPKYLFGLKELAEYLHCSYSKVAKMSSEGTFDKAKKYIGRLLVYDVETIDKLIV